MDANYIDDNEGINKNFLDFFIYWIKFIFGWAIWVVIFFISLFFSLITWNWKETYTLNMKTVITEICGSSTWDIMTGIFDH
jgi:hypothetical protein